METYVTQSPLLLLVVSGRRLVWFLYPNQNISPKSVKDIFFNSSLTDREGLISRWFAVFDVIIAMLLTGAMASAGSISQVGKKGNVHAGWLPICDEVSKYCNQIMAALISGFIGLFLYTIIVLHTITTELNPLLP
ncbi:hypothetical protein KFK09_026541 [Dendrobium nobile]|uniref:CASP-like protein n=1 Tax=Dendrobium nobile TaxID=94219 RepID=A0A8T3A905_DENNO|nr:hypothetical protein KFK09_026541 [Dendrobium nobile]